LERVGKLEKYTLPNWVFKRDGRLVPFEADKISQALFTATEAQGRPNAFLARELTDGVLHFLGLETEGDNPTTEQIAEIVAKVTRELGHPELARTFLAARDIPQEAPLETAGFAEIRPHENQSTARRAVFTRDLVSALESGLLELSDWESAEAIESMVVEPSRLGHSWGESLLDEIVRLRSEVARHFLLDSPDHLLSAAEAPGWIRQLCRLLETLDRQAIVNLNSGAAPAWSREGGVGPLFPGQPGTDTLPSKQAPADVAYALLDGLTNAVGNERVTIDWHLDESTLAAGNIEFARAVSVPPDRWRWTLDRSGQVVALGEGVDRVHACVLIEIGLNLPRFFTLEGIEGRLDIFLDKLPSLANMAISAGVQKRAFLSRAHAKSPTRQTRLAQGFLLYRARAAIRPVGLDEVVRQALGRDASESKTASDLKHQIVKTIHAGATRHGRARNLEIVMDGVWSPRIEIASSAVSREKNALTVLRQAWKNPGVRRVGLEGSAEAMS